MKQRFSPVVLAMAVTAVAFIALPILAILVRAPWSDAWDIVAQKTTRDALLVSLQTSVIAACIASIIGIPLSWVLARSSGRGISV
ncbi:MAG: molybdate transporter permease subunit, partial [Actinomycetota bacterium]